MQKIRSNRIAMSSRCPLGKLGFSRVYLQRVFQTYSFTVFSLNTRKVNLEMKTCKWYRPPAFAFAPPPAPPPAPAPPLDFPEAPPLAAVPVFVDVLVIVPVSVVVSLCKQISSIKAYNFTLSYPLVCAVSRFDNVYAEWTRSASSSSPPHHFFSLFFFSFSQST